MSKKRHRKHMEAERIKEEPRAVSLPVKWNFNWAIVLLLAVAVFIVRSDSFKKEHPLSFDESVYSVLAAQMIKTPGVYNTVSIYQDSIKKGRKLPEYFNRPLFKHPPLFPWLISVSYRILGMSYFSAFKVSLFFGALLIPLAYLFGRTLFDEKTGIYAALIMAIEPVSWIASQKIWVETTLAFFTVLALCLFAAALKRERHAAYFFAASGAAAGLAALTKYPGLLATFIVAVYALSADRRLFRNRAFLLSLAAPFIMLLPWFYRNYQVYGAGLFMGNDEVMRTVDIAAGLVKKLWWCVPLAVLLAAAAWFIRHRITGFWEKAVRPAMHVIRWVFVIAVLLFLAAALRGNFMNAMSLENVPGSGWRLGMFHGQPWYFYLGRIIELSPFYVFAYLGLLSTLIDRGRSKGYAFLYVAAFVILGFYILWGNFQCRYITAVTVPLMLLSARTQVVVFERAGALRNRLAGNAVRGLLIILVIYAAAKTLMIDIVMAMPNNACYF